LILINSGCGTTLFQKQIDVSGIDRGVTVEEISNSGYIITGVTTQYDGKGQDVLLMKTDLKGDTLWTKSYGGQGQDNGWAVRQLNDGGFIIIGYTDSYGAGGMDVFMIKTDSNGDTVWTKTFGGEEDEYGWDIQNTLDGGFIIASQTNRNGSGEIDAQLIKTDSGGNIEWKKSYGGKKVDRIFSVRQTPDGGYIAAGITYSFNSINTNDRDAYLIKTNGSGEMEWFKTFGGDGYDVGHAVSLTNDGGFIIIGYGESFSSNGTRDVYLIKTDSMGEEMWVNVYGEAIDERGLKGEQTSDGGYIVVGITDKYADLFLVKADGNGAEEWTRLIGSKDQVEFGYTVRQTRDGGYILLGHTQSFNREEGDVLLIKTDNKGRTKK
jgi:hypothetical protein